MLPASFLTVSYTHLTTIQANPAWNVVLRKREAFQAAFAGFNPAKVARFGEADVARLMDDPRIIRAQAKIDATIKGAQIYLEMQKAGDDFAEWAWGLVGGKAIQNTGPVPASTELSERVSKELKRRGFKFCGPVIVYAWMQAAGMVNDHAEACFRRKVCARMGAKKFV